VRDWLPRRRACRSGWPMAESGQCDTSLYPDNSGQVRAQQPNAGVTRPLDYRGQKLLTSGLVNASVKFFHEFTEEAAQTCACPARRPALLHSLIGADLRRADTGLLGSAKLVVCDATAGGDLMTRQPGADDDSAERDDTAQRRSHCGVSLVDLRQSDGVGPARARPSRPRLRPSARVRSQRAQRAALIGYGMIALKARDRPRREH